MRKSGKLLCRIMPNLIVGLGAAMPAFADEFPSDGYMLEDMVYEESATYGNMGVYDGAVTATAEYDDILYQIGAGTYLPAGSEGDLETCPENSYCPGVTDATYNETTDQGISSCPSGYPNSAAGASSNTQCYTTCTVSSANIEHATAVDGNDYYDDGTDTCVATACENGYHVEGSSVRVIEQTPLIDVDYTVSGSGYGYGYISADGGNTGNTDTYGLTENNTWATEFGYGVVYGRASCQATPHDPGIEYIMANQSGLKKATMSPDQVRSDLTPIVGAAKANYMADVVAGIADGTKDTGAFNQAKYVVFGLSQDALTTGTGKYCYCQMTGFQSGSSSVVNIASAPWVFNDVYSSAYGCANGCASSCAGYLPIAGTDFREFRGAVFGALDSFVAGTCAANEITINWMDATDEDIDANNAGMCTYGGDIRTPVKAATKPGKTFVGWKFSK